MSKYEKVREVARKMIHESDTNEGVNLCMGIIIGAHALEAIGDDEDPGSDRVRGLLERATANELGILLDKAKEELFSMLQPGGDSPDD